jgi:hypothetical protein
MHVTDQASPRLVARIAGAFYLGEMLAHAPGVLIIGKLVVLGDAAVTATNILGHVPLLRFAFAADVLGFAFYIVVTALLYRVLRPVNETVSLVAAFFSLGGCVIGALSCVLAVAPLIVLRDAQFLHAFTLEQLQEFGLLSLKLYVQVFNLSFVFFGFYCLLIGSLVFRSGFMPRIVGVLMAIAGLGWLTFLSPPLAGFFSRYILLPGLAGEGLLTAWLLVVGLDAERWNARVAAGPEHETCNGDPP